MSLINRLEILYRRMKEVGAAKLEFALGAQEKLRIVLKGEQAKSQASDDRIAASDHLKFPDGAKETSQAGFPVKAPLSGIFYGGPSPSAPSFVQEGSGVRQGDVLCIIEAMKVMNEITSPREGRILKILGINGKHVKKGDAIFLVDDSIKI